MNSKSNNLHPLIVMGVKNKTKAKGWRHLQVGDVLYIDQLVDIINRDKNITVKCNRLRIDIFRTDLFGYMKHLKTFDVGIGMFNTQFYNFIFKKYDNKKN